MFRNLTTAASLNALRAFEAMARTGRATTAAEELGVTHSAISRQVRGLERRLGVRLFEGPKHALALTAAGAELASDLTPAFEMIGRAVGRTGQTGAVVSIAANVSLTSKWLIPRLPLFAETRPDARVRLLELPSHALKHGDADLVLRLLGHAAVPVGHWTVLADNWIGPVAASGPERPASTVRLSTRTHPGGWTDWAAASGESIPRWPEMTFGHLHLALEAAVAGLGVAVLPWVVVADDIAAGRLREMSPFVKDGGALVLWSRERRPSRHVRAFRDWLAEQAEAASGTGEPPHLPNPFTRTQHAPLILEG